MSFTDRSISQLQFQQRWVNSLPADPLDSNRPRAVLGACHSRVQPTPVAAPHLVALVPEVAALLDLSATPTPELTEVLAGNRVLAGMAPYAACYGGHQFGSWAGQLGDGRAITLAEVENARGERWEMQLKGAGPTPYSRRADGRAVLRSSLRELVCSEAMFHLGVPTTRALSLVTTGEPVLRDLLYDGHPAHEPGAVVCRVAPSFLRFGNYEIFASRDDEATLRRLVAYTLEHHYPAYAAATPKDIAAFFDEVCRRTAELMVHWTRVGFVHGVMNTDNMSILGLTIDYGPYGWVESYDPSWTPNITDAGGRRYRFGNQPRIAHWNLLQLGQSLVGLVGDPAPLEASLRGYVEYFTERVRLMLLSKLGLSPRDGDDELLAELEAILGLVEADMTLFYRLLAELDSTPGRSTRALFERMRAAYYAPEQVTAEQVARIGTFLERYLERARSEGLSDTERRARMNAVNPIYVPRNYLVQQTIEKVQAGDDGALSELLDVLRRPYEVQPGREAYAEKRPEWARHRPGCSMLSCSS